MNGNIFKKTIFLSLLGHITIFSIFSLSFGNKIPKANHAQVAFWGAILRSSDLTPGFLQAEHHVKLHLTPPLLMQIKDSGQETTALTSNYYLKPAITLEFNKDKLIFIQEQAVIPIVQARKRPQIMFYPHLPRHFLLYFKDRESVHIELIFNIISSGRTNSIAIKRKISSGNLDADLLVMRYISHYLFIQQGVFTTDKWQTVKIDLSTKND